MINNSRNILQQAVFVTLLAALAMYGLHYHIAKTLIHICAFLSLINIATCIVNRDKTKISLPKNIKIFIATLFISCISITLYTFLSEENVAQRFF
jgi:hypothetical protein